MAKEQRRRNEISIQFSNNAAASFSETEKQINEEVIYNAINGFENESEILKEQNLLFYFGWKNKHILGYFNAETLGFIECKTTPGIKRLGGEKNDIKDFESFDCIIYLSTDIGKDESKIFKTFTIIHELQHLLQRIYLKNHYLKHFVLNNYYRIRGFDTNELPTEHDAIRKAKVINYKIFGKEKVDLFIDKKIMTSIKGNIKYWEKIKNININEYFDLESEMRTVWDKHKNDIKEKTKIDEGLRKAYELFRFSQIRTTHDYS